MRIDLTGNMPGPIVVIGASGFVGANLLRHLLKIRPDAYGTFFSDTPWRLHNLPAGNLLYLDILDPSGVRDIMDQFRPQVVLDCSAFGAYSFENDFGRIHRTNYLGFIQLMELLAGYEISAYIHAGSSSEYGDNAAGPDESASLRPNSHYAISKAAASQAIYYYGKKIGLPVANLRLYSVYGQYEDSSRLIPSLCHQALSGKLPPLASPEISRDFVHIDDVCEAFIAAAALMKPEVAGESFNIGTGCRTTLAELANIAKHIFDLKIEPEFSSLENRFWDVPQWYAATAKAREVLHWESAISLEDGLKSTALWWSDFTKATNFEALTKKRRDQTSKNSISAIVACYNNQNSLPELYERLVAVFQKQRIDYEIILVNDGSADNSKEIIQNLSRQDPHVLGINHSRRFGPQAAFRSGMELAAKEACVLLEGHLQDPPEVIPDFILAWRAGADIVYGRKIKREMPCWHEWGYKLFYRILASLSDINIPKDAGDFSLIDRTARRWILKCREQDGFVRGLRAYVGFKQAPVDYVCLKRRFGCSGQGWLKSIGLASGAILSFSRAPLHLLSTIGALLFICSLLFSLTSIGLRIFAPHMVPKGLTTVILLIIIFGSSTLMGMGLLGEYIGKILEEAKARPAFIRKSLVKNGQEFADDGTGHQ